MKETREASQPGKNLWIRIYAALVALVALGYIYGGIKLAMLGGAFYYALAGAVLCGVAFLLWRRNGWGCWLMGALIAATWLWTVGENGLDPWAMVPRLGLLSVLGLVLLLPVLRRGLRNGPDLSPWIARGAVAVLALAILVPGLGGLRNFGWEGNPQPVAAIGPGEPANPDWPDWGNSAAGTRYSGLDQITPENVGALEVAWTYSIGEAKPNGLSVTPLKIGDLVYVCSSRNRLAALDAETGAERWVFDPEVDMSSVPFHSCRGVAYYKVPETSGHCAERIYTTTVDARVVAVDARVGTRCTGFGENGEVSMLEGLGEVQPGYYLYNGAPTIARGRIVLGGTVVDNQYWGEPSGVIRALDAVTGELVWAYDVGRPDRRGAPEPGEIYTPGTPNVWAQMAYDDALGLIYAPTGNTTPDYFGAQRRPFDEEITSAILALDIETGERRWVFRTLHHDIWDYDLASQPVLMDLPGENGETVPVIIQPTKRGELFMLDRRTGEPVAEVVEKPVPQAGAVPEERLSPTQPFSVGLPSLAGEPLREAAMWGLTPFDQMWCRIKFREARYDGTLTPPGLQPMIQYPGYLGGMNWGSVSVDTRHGVLIAVTNYIANYMRLVTREEADAAGAIPMGEKRPGLSAFMGILAQEGLPYAATTRLFMSPLEVPCQQPPWSRITAIDLAAGEIMWSRPLGSGEEAGPFGIKSRLPLTVGVPAVGGATLTAGGVTFVGASVDKTFRAFDSQTGKLLWEFKLPESANSIPATYWSAESGRQFVVVAAGGHRSIAMASKNVDDIIAFALPKDMVKGEAE